jgi:CelD/BcsL family acetyltransferase involved in cellulose biosynthesis
MATVQTSVIRDLGELESISAEWDGLLDRSAAPEIFRTHDWMSAWWEVFGGDGQRQPLVVVVRQGPTLVGLAPFVVRDVTWAGRVRLRRLELMGTGEDPADEVCSYFGDIIATRGFEEVVSAQVWRFLQENRALWDLAEFPAILESSLLARLLRPAAHDSGRASSGAVFGRRFFMDLSTGGFDGFLEGLSKKRMKRFQSYRRRLEKDQIGEERLVAREDIPGFLSDMSRLNRLRRGSQGRASAWGSARFRLFHELVAPRLWEKGRLDLRVWKREGRCVAALYHFLYAGTVYGYQIGFDTAAFGSVSPGLVAIGQSIEWAFASGCTRFDFLVSGDGSYKEDYPCLTEPVLDLTVYNDTTAGRLWWLARQARDALRDVRSRIVAALNPQASAPPPTEPAVEVEARPAAA